MTFPVITTIGGIIAGAVLKKKQKDNTQRQKIENSTQTNKEL